MNFEFLKDLRGLDIVYQPCTDAEELVKSKPYLSLTAARKSAELLAKFIYMAAHTDTLQGLTFADILADPQVRNFVHNRNVMDAFHFIRKSGNKAVHGEDEVSTDNALAVLQNLHYIAGETARQLSLIRNYPDFDADIPEKPNAELHEYGDLSADAIKMFLQYMDEAKGKTEEALEPHFPQRYEDYNGSHWEILNIHEQLIFDHRPYLKSTALYLKEYIDFWIAMSHIGEIETEDNGRPIENAKATITLTLDGEKYTSDDEDSLQDALITKLPFAKCIILDNRVYGGISRFSIYGVEENKPGTVKEWLELYERHDPSLWGDYGLLGKMMELRRRELFTYKMILEYNDPWDFEYHLIKNGKILRLVDFLSKDFMEIQKGHSWENNSMMLAIGFGGDDKEKRIEAIHQAVREYVDESELSFIEDVWEDDEEAYGTLLSGTSIQTDDLSTLEAFLDRINDIVESVIETAEGYDEDAWLYSIESLGVARVGWTKYGFVIVGGMM